MLCLRCGNRRDAVPDEVEVEGVDIAESLKAIWEAIAGRKYPVRIYCSARKAVVVGDPASPAKSVAECAEFAES